MAQNLIRAPGRQESDLAPRSGLRSKSIPLHLISAQTQNVNARPIGGVASAAVTAWTNLALNNRNVPFGGTLVAQLIQGSTTTGTIQLRIRGYDVLGQYQEEITPAVAFVAKTNNFVYCAKVWAYVIDVAFMSTGLDIAGDTLSLGTRWDWTRTIDATNEHLFGRNLGIPIPTRLGRRTEPAALAAHHQPPGFGGVRLDLANATLTPNPEIAPRFTEPLGHARVNAAVAGTPADGNTVVLDGLTYTWRTVITPAARDVLIGVDGTAALANLTAAIIRDASGAGVTYSTATVAHPTVTVLSNRGTTIVFGARVPGARGNLIAVSEVSANFSFTGGATALVGGYDYPIELQSLLVHDITGAAAAGALMQLSPQQVAVGWNETGWDGPVEKLHVLRQSDVANWAVADAVRVMMVVESSEVASY